MAKTALINSQSIQPNYKMAHLLLTINILLLSASLYQPILTWILLLVLCAVVMRVALILNLQKHLPTVRTLNLLALLSGIGLIYSGWQLGVLLGMVNLLVMACALKLMLLRSPRDYYQLVTSLLFLIGCGFVFQQSIVMTGLYLFLTFLNLLSLSFFFSPSTNLKVQTMRIIVMCLQALPIGVLLFLLLPQLPPLWQTPSAKSAQTGLAEKISPGDIAELSQSTELAFRATFKGNTPRAQERYWRAIVLEDFDGKNWQVHPERKLARRQHFRLKQEFSPLLSGDFFKYEVMAEPTQQRWLFALDLAVPDGPKSNAEIWQGYDYQLISQRPLASQYQYRVRSYPQALPLQGPSSLDMRLNLTTPLSSNPRTQQWVARLRQQHPLDSEFVSALLNYFIRQDFRYTLRPQTMYSDPIDQFLFDKQAGFCSHYASALAYSLRLGGIPARVVAGYQGGEMNSSDQTARYLSVYQYDAHAWVEAWGDKTGWTRLDPTSLVAPDRINFGLQQAMLEEGSFLADSPFSLTKLADIAWLNDLRLALADIDYHWSRWVLGYDNQTQTDLFKSIIGKLSPQRLAFLGLGVVVLISLLLGLFFLPHYFSNRLKASHRYYQQALSLLAKTGIHRQPWQGAQAFSVCVSEQLGPKAGQIFKRLSDIYQKLEYQAKPPGAQQNKDKKNTKARSELKKAHRRMRQCLRQLKAQLASVSS